jgi:hypothetical protein
MECVSVALGGIPNELENCAGSAAADEAVADEIFQEIWETCAKDSDSMEDTKRFYDRLLVLGHDPRMILAGIEDFNRCSSLEDYLQSCCWNGQAAV